ncbi:MAG: hypothetical protein ROW52_00545 [Anaerolineaceae bacterium]|jgi:hypothetical protein
MNTNSVKSLVVAVVAVVALGALGLGVAFAQNSAPINLFTPGGMMGGYWNQQGGSFDMGAMHNWMISTGGMHTLVWGALADALDLTSDELTAELTSGKTLAVLAEEKGLDRAALVAELKSAHQAGLAQAVIDGILTQQQADAMLAQMAGRYEWMLDNMGAGYGMMGGRGGMMGGFYGQQGGNGQFAPGGCHSIFAPSASQNRP